MKLTVEFPSVSYREGPAGVGKLAKAIEDIGYDQLDIFDHVVMGFPTEDRDSRYAAKMPILEALMTLSYAAALTSTIGLGTEVLVLPQRQPVLVAKQVSTLYLGGHGHGAQTAPGRPASHLDRWEFGSSFSAGWQVW